MNDLKPRFSFFPPDGGIFSCRTQPPEPCLKSKCRLVGVRATQNRQGENKNIFSRNRGRGVFNQPTVFDYTYWILKTASKPAIIALFSFRKHRCPFH